MSPIERVLQSAEWKTLSDALRVFLGRIFGDFPVSIVVRFRYLPEATLPLYMEAVAAQTKPKAFRPNGSPWHASDFRTATWKEHSWSFTPTQAEIIKVMREAWEEGHPVMSQDSILRAAGSDSRSLSAIFQQNGKSHPAYGILVVRVTSGMYRLAYPTPEEELAAETVPTDENYEE